MTEIKKEPEERKRSQQNFNLNEEQVSSRSAILNIMNGHLRSSRTRGYRHNHEQKLFLVDFMEAHPEFAFGRYAGPRQKSQALWVKLTEEMNARGPKKTVAQWQKAWTDVKSRARARVSAKANNPSFDVRYDLDGRVLTLLETLSENSASKRTEYVPSDSDFIEGDISTHQPTFLHTLETDTLPPEMVLLPETEAESEPLESCSMTDVKDILQTNNDDDDDLPVTGAHLDGQNCSYNTTDAGQNFDQNGTYDVTIDTGQNYDEFNTYNTNNMRHTYYQRHSLSNIRNRIRKLANRHVTARPSFSPSASNIQRRQTETLEAISKTMLQNAENEKERNKLMSESLEISKARLKAEQERNNLLRDLVSTLKGISPDKIQRLC